MTGLQENKNDLNRIGLFSELGYISIGDPFKSRKNGKYIFLHMLFRNHSRLSS